MESAVDVIRNAVSDLKEHGLAVFAGEVELTERNYLGLHVSENEFDGCQYAFRVMEDGGDALLDFDESIKEVGLVLELKDLADLRVQRRDEDQIVLSELRQESSHRRLILSLQVYLDVEVGFTNVLAIEASNARILFLLNVEAKCLLALYLLDENWRPSEFGVSSA